MFRITVAALCVPFVMNVALAQEWPTNPIELVVQFPGGTTTDAVARHLGKYLGDELGQPVVVQNKPGAGGVIGVGHVARSKPDGYTIGTVNMPTLTIIPHLQTVSYDPLRDFTHLAVIGPYDYGIFVKANAPWATFEELVTYARENPGKLSYGTLAAGTTNQLTMQELGEELGIDWLYVPYKGDNESLVALLSDQIDLMNGSPNVTLPQVASGDIRMLVSTGPQRWEALPDVPTLKETGLTEIQQSSFLSLAAPKDLAPEAEQKLKNALESILTDKQFITEIQEKYGQAVVFESGENYAQFIAENYKERAQDLK